MFSTTIKGELSMYFIDDVLHLINYCHKPPKPENVPSHLVIYCIKMGFLLPVLYD